MRNRRVLKRSLRLLTVVVRRGNQNPSGDRGGFDRCNRVCHSPSKELGQSITVSVTSEQMVRISPQNGLFWQVFLFCRYEVWEFVISAEAAILLNLASVQGLCIKFTRRLIQTGFRLYASTVISHSSLGGCSYSAGILTTIPKGSVKFLVRWQSSSVLFGQCLFPPHYDSLESDEKDLQPTLRQPKTHALAKVLH